ncbi:hypothetical protein [Streptomyces tremellae]|uniref:SAV-6107-like HEPN domain-containing protein n=1 Tax=Streptomyces tremellae TaxID=1124239 RepID=A0ABP7F1A9_9ACTN
MTRRPGQWPVPPRRPVPEDDEQGRQHLAASAIRARFHVVLGSIRADLEEQPSPSTVRAAARCWTDAITNLADEAVQRLKKAG